MLTRLDKDSHTRIVKKLCSCAHLSDPACDPSPARIALLTIKIPSLRSIFARVPSAAANMALVCGHCNVLRATQGLWWQDRWFCGAVCSHAAGDRTSCHGWSCGCTAYAKKRRWLRAHREELRIARDLIAERGLEAELENRLIRETGNTAFWLGSDDELDEPSDADDPEEKLRAAVEGLRAEASDQRSMVQAVQGALECRCVQLDLERARMQLEDARSRARSRSPRR